MHSCGQLKLNWESLFSSRFWAHRTWCIPRVENWRIKHLCNMQLAVISATAQCNYTSTLPLSGAHRKDDGIGSFQWAQRADGDATVKLQDRAERLSWISWLVWHNSGVFGQGFVCGQPLFSSCCRSLSQRVAGSTSCLSERSNSHTALWTIQWFHDGMVTPWCLQQLDIRWNNQTLVDDSSCSLKRPNLSAPCTECWPESGVGNDFKAWLEQIQEYHKWGHRGYIGENDRLAIRFTSPCEAFPSL